MTGAVTSTGCHAAMVAVFAQANSTTASAGRSSRNTAFTILLFMLHPLLPLAVSKIELIDQLQKSPHVLVEVGVLRILDVGPHFEPFLHFVCCGKRKGIGVLHIV